MVSSRSILTAVLATGLLLISPAILVQGQTPPTTPTPKNAATGLNALSDDALFTELASRGLDQLLQRAFEINHVPQEKQESIKTLSALRKLGDPNSKLSPHQRQTLIDHVVAGIDSTLPKIKDPHLLVQQANLLITESVNNDVNTLEFWGENPRLQASLHPIVLATDRILDRALIVGNEDLETIANKIRRPNDAAAQQYLKLESLLTTADFTRTMNQYALALSIDRADPQRKQIATQAIDKLRELDEADSGVQVVVKNRIGKLLIARGDADDYDKAKKEFQAVIDQQTTPPPDVGQTYEALYFSVVADLTDKKLDAAQQALEKLRTWQKTNIPADNKTWQAGADAAIAMMEYRIISARADSTPGQQKQLNEQANQILVNLVKAQPAYGSVIYQQLADRLAPSTDLTKADSLMLRALMRQGEQEAMKPQNEARDASTIKRALTATDLFLSRQGQQGIGNDDIATAMLLRGVLLEADNQPLDAAEAYMAFVGRFKTNANATFALDNAMALINPLLADRESNARIDDLYTRVLAAAVDEPFNRIDLAYQAGRQLQQTGQYALAQAAYAKVLPNDPNKLWASYFQMIAIKQRLDADRVKTAGDKTKLPVDQAGQLQEQVQTLAQQVRTEAQGQISSTTDAQQRSRAQRVLAQTTLMSADLANRVQNQPARAIEILNNFESTVKGMSQADQLLTQALFIRVDAFMDLKQNTQATDALVELLQTRGGDEGAQIIYDLLTRLNNDFEAARQAANRPEMEQLAAARAALTGYLVQWAQTNKKDAVYQYRVYDAESQAQAARLTNDPARRQQLLKASEQRYQALLGEKNDPVVQLGLANAAYDLGDYRTAQPYYTRLIGERKLGGPKRYNPEGELVDNDQYWEAMYKLFKSNLEIAAADSSLSSLADQTRQRLAQLYIMQGKNVGGQRWGQEFEALREQLLPDMKLPS